MAKSKEMKSLVQGEASREQTVCGYGGRPIQYKYQKSRYWLPCYIYAALGAKENLNRVKLYG